MPDIRIKRVYDPAGPEDGLRVLVDRLWPRGVTKEKLQAVLWLKASAPSTGLRKWFGHDPAKWQEFRHRYLAELDKGFEGEQLLLDEARKGRVTLLYAARDPECNHALVLREHLLSRAGKPPG